MKKLCPVSVTIVLTLMLFSGLTAPQFAEAQYRFDALRYSFEIPGQDPSNMAMGGASVALGNGFGSFVMNPATSAMKANSYFSFGLGSRDVRETDTYLNTTSQFNDSQTGITNFGFVFQAPTERGSLAFGIGYTQTADFNRALSADALNPFSTITDFFVDLAGPDYFDIVGGNFSGPAWEAIAIDTLTVNDELILESSWRSPFSSEYVGVYQFVEMTERGHMGEYALFAATEFMENFFVGLSFNIPSGSYSYRRTFIEDAPGDIEHDYDVISIFVDEEIDASIRGFSARIGTVYRVFPWFNLGASYTTPTRIEVSERFSNLVNTTFIPGTFGDGDIFEGEFSAPFDFQVTRPARFALGAAVENLGGLSATLTAERVDYSTMTVSLPDERVLERDENRAIRDEFQEVLNLRAGVSYTIAETVRLRGGYALYPSPKTTLPDFINADRHYYSAGIGFGFADGLMLDFTLQMGRWQDENMLYDFIDNDGFHVGEFVDEEVTRYHGSIGIRYNF